MRRILIAAVVGSAVMAAVPTVALAGHSHGSRHRHSHHSAVRHERFGSNPAVAPTGSTGATGPMSGPVNSPAAGTVASFMNGVLTISLTNGQSVSGTVTSNTELSCGNGFQSDFRTDGGPGPSGNGGDNGGSGPSGNGGDNGGSGPSGNGGDNGGAGNDGGDNGGEDPGDGPQASSCTTASLVHGAVVQEAELAISSSGSTWTHIDLAS